jgi:hypothetical protein
MSCTEGNAARRAAPGLREEISLVPERIDGGNVTKSTMGAIDDRTPRSNFSYSR